MCSPATPIFIIILYVFIIILFIAVSTHKYGDKRVQHSSGLHIVVNDGP